MQYYNNEPVVCLPCNKLQNSYEFEVFFELMADSDYYTTEILNKKENLFFVKVCDHTYFELASRSTFKKVDDENYYDENSGLFFNENDLVTLIEYSKLSRKMSDKSYLSYVRKYFEIYRSIQKEDNKLIAKTHMLLLSGKNK